MLVGLGFQPEGKSTEGLFLEFPLPLFPSLLVEVLSGEAVLSLLCECECAILTTEIAASGVGRD